ncbi:hypothetical protein MMC20_006682 [Loxospora ochrophaea]|nr:hypothetical protein [Loxospora ochrophaea]
MSLDGADGLPLSSSPPFQSAQPRQGFAPYGDSSSDDAYQPSLSDEEAVTNLRAKGKQKAGLDESSESERPVKSFEGHRGAVNTDAGARSGTAGVRANKYYGPPSTWRGWTAAERQLAASLDQIRARDLSIHLYNAHALKRRARLLKEEENQDGIERPGSQWVPPNLWTAWPMEADEVPRPRERSIEDDVEDFGYLGRLTRGGYPSEELEDVLLGTILKEAKERFLGRPLEASDLDSETGVESSFKGSNSRSRSRKRSASKDPESKIEYRNRPLDSPRPVVMADDEQAKELLQPEIRHILSKLDDLLMALHRSRQTYCTRRPDSQSEPQTEAEELQKNSRTAGSDTENRKSRSGPTLKIRKSSPGPPSASLPRKKSRPRSSSRASSNPSTRPNSRSSSKSKTLNPRDWSDVLGTASLIGWDPVTLDNATKRCTALFNEGMTFRTFSETASSKTKTYLPNQPPSPSPRSSPPSSPNPPPHPHPQPPLLLIPCPIPTCPSSHRPSLHPSYLPRHLRRKHSSLPKPTRRHLSRSLSRSHPTTTPSLPSLSSSLHLTCPFLPTCPSTRPFASAYSLKRHLQKKHPENLPPRREDSSPETSTADIETTGSALAERSHSRR